MTQETELAATTKARIASPRRRPPTRISDLVRMDLTVLKRTSNYLLLLPAIVLFSLLAVHSVRVHDRAFYFFFMLASMSTVFNAMFARSQHEFLLYSLLPLSETRLLAAKNLSCLVFSMGPAIVMTATLEVLKWPARGLIPITLLQFLFAFLFVSAAGNVISARRTKEPKNPFSFLGTLFQGTIMLLGMAVHWVSRRMLETPVNELASLLVAVIVYALSCVATVELLRRARIGYMDRT